MRAIFDRQSDELLAKYIYCLEAFTADFAIVPGSIEFRCDFALLSDHEPRHFKLKVPALPGDTEGARNLIVVMIFEGLEGIIDELIRAATN